MLKLLAPSANLQASSVFVRNCISRVSNTGIALQPASAYIATRLDPTRLDPTRLDPTRLDPTRLAPAYSDAAMGDGASHIFKCLHHSMTAAFSNIVRLYAIQKSPANACAAIVRAVKEVHSSEMCHTRKNYFRYKLKIGPSSSDGQVELIRLPELRCSVSGYFCVCVNGTL